VQRLLFEKTAPSEPAPAPVDDRDPDGLRSFQREDHDAAWVELDKPDVRATLMVNATGLGKTVIGSVFAKTAIRQRGGRVLWAVTGEELCDQAKAALERITGTFVSLERAGYKACDTRIVVGSVPTMKGDRLTDWSRGHFTHIIFDEAHHAAANGPRAIFDHFEGAKILGLTATPQRHDGKATGIVFDSIVPVKGEHGGWHREGRQMHWGITHGYLVPMLGWDEKIDEIDLSKVKTVAGDLQKAGVEEAVLKAAGAIARRWYHFVGEETSPYGKRRSLGFCPGVGSAHLVASTLNEIRPNCARVVDGKTPDDERSSIVKAFARDEFQFLVNCMVFREGFDDPGIQCVMNARPTKSLSLYIQIAGRGGRPLKGIAELPTRAQRISAIAASAKPNVLLLHIGTNNAGKHQLISPVTLDGRYEPAEQARAAAMIREKPDLTLEEALEKARATIIREVAERSAAAAKAAAMAEIRSRGRAYDPFASYGIKDPDAREGIDLGTHPELATPKDLRWLAAMDLPREGMTHSQVRALQRAHFAREDAGLADFRTLNRLHAKEIQVVNISKVKARALLDAIAANRGWRPPQAEIDAILGGGR
jgi:superfamily II DNA or RNA helicase